MTISLSPQKSVYDHPATPANIQKYFDESRARLGIDVVDLLYLHRLDPDTPMEAQAEGLAKLVDAGSVRHVGLSNFAAWEVMKFRDAARSFRDCARSAAADVQPCETTGRG